MMRIGVISDTHGSAYAVERAVLALPDVDEWVHLGDVVSDAAALAQASGKVVHAVRGNCDYDLRKPLERVLEFENVRVLALHGHQYSVRYDRSRLYYRAEELGCAAVLYGHTHVSLVEASGRVISLNPGSPTSPREGRAPSIALLTIQNGGAYPHIVCL